MLRSRRQVLSNGGTKSPAGWRESRVLIGIEFAVVAGIFVADWYKHIYFNKTVYLFALGWLSLLLRGVRWRDLGLRLGPDWKRHVVLGVAAGVAMEALELFATQPLLVRLTGNYPDLSVFHSVVGNGRLLLVSLAFSWVVAGLGEELVWRGYLLNRMADLCGRSNLGWSIALVLVSLAFGFAHFNQGPTGIIENAIDGMLLGLLYLACGRNLIAPIVAHGTTDSVDFLLIFSGHYPGMG